MDYLNYGNKFQQEPLDPHELQDKVQLAKDDFSFGDLSQQKVPPQAPPQTNETKDELMQLFAIPLLICPCPFEYGKELEWIKNQSYRRENKNQETGEFLNRQSDDTFILDKPEMSRVKQFIEAKIHEYVTNIMESDNEMVITQSWLNKNGKGEAHHAHKHPNSMISGVWYPQIHKNLPPIKFTNSQQRDVSFSIKKYNRFNSATFMLPMNKGELILFPSNLSHSVNTNQFDEERISLSFNTWAKGSLGDKELLTYLPFDRLM